MKIKRPAFEQIKEAGKTRIPAGSFSMVAAEEKKGKNSCGISCSGCSMAGNCNNKKEEA